MSLHDFACSGYMDPNEAGPDNYGFGVIFDESRGPVIEKRGETIQTRIERLSTIWAGSLYQAEVVQADSHTDKVTLTQPGNKEHVFFVGTYALVQNDSGAKLKLDGKINLSPEEKKQEFQKISTVLDCVNISN